MRQIKFRAFVRGLMVDVVSIDFVNKYITWDDNQWDRCVPPNKCYEIESFDNIKLMQFTGLLDKNGKEIWEGDVIRLDSFSPSDYCVSFIEGAFCLTFIQGEYKGEYSSDIHYIQHAGHNQSTVITNIHDNPSLLTNK